MSEGYDNKGLDVGTSKTDIAAESQVNVTFGRDGPCDRRTKLEKVLVVVIVLLLVVFAVVLALILVRKDSDDKEQGICKTGDCTLAAARLLENMDLTVDPCEDFYMYACGTWKKKHVIPEDQIQFSLYHEVINDVLVTNKYLLEDTKKYSDVEAVAKARDMFASCIDLETIEIRSSAIAIPLLNELGGWPVLESNPGGNWSEDNFSLPNLLVRLNQYNINPLIHLSTDKDLRESDKNIIYLMPPGFGLPGRLYYLQEGLSFMREAYVALATSVAVLFGANRTTAESEMRDMLALETDIANITTRAEDLRDFEATLIKMSIEELKHNFTEPVPADPVQFDWLEYIKGVFDLENVKIHINASEEVIVQDVAYFKKLFNVLQKHRKRTITNYAVWRMMMVQAPVLDSRFRNLISEYTKVTFGIVSSDTRWQDCVRLTTATFGMAVGHMFVKETFDESAKTAMTDMIDNIRGVFNELLDENDWMDEPTKQLAREKANAMKEKVGYPDEIMETEYINKLYENIFIDKGELFENLLNIRKISVSDNLKNLRKTNDKYKWPVPPSTVNAFNQLDHNTIVFAAGQLQPPFYMKGQPKSMNYGGIGATIGHEITHGFDDIGRQFDKDGELKEWWDEKIIKNFKERAQCIIDQYGGYSVPEVNLNVNGINTQGENIADNGGTKQAFRAYRKWVAKQGTEEPLLPGVNFTHNQLFFITYAQVYCTNDRKEGLINQLNTGVHSPNPFRVIGTLQNSPDFSAAFGCKKNDYMNPEKKCYVW